MSIEFEEYKDSCGISVTELIKELQQIVENNPHLDFSKMGVSLNSEYTAERITLSYWKVGDKMRAGMDIG